MLLRSKRLLLILSWKFQLLQQRWQSTEVFHFQLKGQQLSLNPEVLHHKAVNYALLNSYASSAV